ncbi:MAG: hypothetical protein ACI915_003220 [Gammaproteobacteria bacterium]|jgi:uncharacterized protein YbjT (DUF2867 family)
MRIEPVAIFGASGFVGTRLANQLAAQGVALRLFTRSRNRARNLWQLPNCEVIETDIYAEAGISKYLAGCNAVINLVGIINEKGDDGTGFRRAHTELTRTIIKVCFNTGVRRYIHMSALGADAFAASYYLRTKGEAENAAMAAHDEGLQTTVFRPSVMFGPGDSFYNRFANLLKISPVVFPLACANSKFQPVYVGDVCRAIIGSLSDRSTFGNRYDLGGPEQKTLREIVDYAAELTGRHRIVIPLGAFLSNVQANVLEHFPGKPFSRDNLRSTSEDSVCRGENGLVSLGIQPTSVSEIVPTYLGGKYERSRFYNFRADARRGR